MIQKRALPNPWIIVSLLMALHFGLGMAALRHKSPAMDEYVYINSGCHNLREREIRFTPEHPPLCLLLGALPSLFLDLQWDRADPLWNLSGAWKAELAKEAPDKKLIADSIHSHWNVGCAFLYDWNADRADRLIFRAHLMMMLLSTMTGLLVFLWGRRMGSDLSGILALLIFATQPAMLAHGPLVTTDAGFTLFTTWFFFEITGLVRLDGRPGRDAGRITRLGLAVAGMMLTKFSFLITGFLGAAWAAGFVLSLWFRGERPRALGVMAGLAGGAVLGVLLVCAFYLIIFGRFPLGAYREGFSVLQVVSDRDDFYFLGRLGNHFPGYFALSLALKLPPATLAAVVLALVGGAMGVLKKETGGGAELRRMIGGPLCFAAGYLIFATLYFNNMGVRYLLPVIPLVSVIAASGVTRLTEIAVRGRVVGVFAAAQAVSCLLAFPDYMSYMNAASWPTGKFYLLGDSDLDWAQDLPALEERLRGTDPARMCGYVYPKPMMTRLKPPVQMVSKELLERLPAGSLVTVSAHYLQMNPSLREMVGPISEPPEVLHDTIYIYRLK